MISEFQDLIDALFKRSSVRYSTVIDFRGEKLAGGMKPGVESISTNQSERRLEMQSVLILKMAEGFEPECGRLYYSAIRWEKIVALEFLLSSEEVLNVTIDADTPLEEAFEIEKMVKEWKNRHAVGAK